LTPRQLTLAKVVFILALCAGAALHLSAVSSFADEPLGCDWFGYLRQAALFRSQGPAGLDTELMPAVSRPLLAIAKTTDEPPSAWREAIAPQCHHYKPAVDRIVLQYPPGTGFLLSLMPENGAARDLLIASVLAILALALFGTAVAPTLATAWVTSIAGYAMAAAISRHWTSFSLGPAIVAAVLAGGLSAIAFRGRRALPFLLLGLVLGLGSAVRLPNVWLAAGALALLAWELLRRPSLPAFRQGLMLALGLAIGLAPVLVADLINAGSPFATTYSPTDAQAPDFSAAVLWHGVMLYLVPVLVGLAMFLPSLAFAELRNRATLSFLITLVAGVVFFLSHPISADYYILPTVAFVIAGVVANGLIVWRRPLAAPERWWPGASGIAAIVAVAGFTLFSPAPNPRTEVDAAVKAAFGQKTLAWADMYGGFFVLNDGQYAAKLTFAEPPIQDKLVGGLFKAGWEQLFVADSERMRAAMARLRETVDFEPLGQAFGQPVFRMRLKP